MIELRPLSLAVANDAIRRWHRHHKPVRAHRFAIGACVAGELVGAVIVGNPVARQLARDPLVAEVTRLVTNGEVPHVASRLLGAAWRAAHAMGVTRMVSYTREDEPGTCYRAAGWIPVAEVRGREWAGVNKPGRWLPGLYSPATEIVDRMRWERVA